MKTIYKKTFVVEYVIPETEEEEKEIQGIIERSEQGKEKFKNYNVIDNRSEDKSYKLFNSHE